jgi:methyl-accepting chemotaxis protein
MTWFNDLRLRAKLFTAFGAVTSLIVVLGVFAANRLGAVNDRTVEIATNWLPTVEVIGALNGAVGRQRVAHFRHVVAQTADGRREVEEMLATRAAEIDSLYAAYQPLVANPEERALTQKFRRDYDALTATWTEIQPLSRGGRTAEATAKLVASKPAFDQILGDLDALYKLNRVGSEAARQQAASVYTTTRMALGVVVAACVALAMALAMLIARMITRTVDEVRDRARRLESHCVAELGAAMDALAKGDLTVAVTPTTAPVEVRSRDEIGELAGAINGLISSTQSSIASYNAARGQMREVLGGVQQSSVQVAAAAEQIAGGSQALAQGASEQAANLEEVASSIAELSAMASQMSGNANEARGLAADTQSATERGAAQMHELSNALANIKASAAQTSVVIKTIEEIAFQTNLLALNAAVEAARAGDAGAASRWSPRRCAPWPSGRAPRRARRRRSSAARCSTSRAASPSAARSRSR